MSRKYEKESYQSVYFRIWIDNIQLSPFEHSLVEEIVYENNSTGSDMVSIHIIDPDYTIIGNPKIVKSTPCKVEAGYMTNYRTWINGYISALDVDFPETGYPTLTIHVMDKTYIMNRVERKKTYTNISYANIAKQIAKRYGLTADVDATGNGGKKHESVTQSYETDIQFLTRLAGEIGYLVFVNSSGTTLYFKDMEKYTKQKASHTLWYRLPPFDIMSFSPRIVQADQPDEIEESDIDNKSKKPTKSTVTTQNANNTSGGATSKSSSGSKKKDSGGQMKYDPYTGKWRRVMD